MRSSALKHSGMDHTVFTLQNHHTCLHLVSLYQMAPAQLLTSNSSHHLSTQRGWKAELAYLADLCGRFSLWMVTHQLKVRCGPGKVEVHQKQMFYHWATLLTIRMQMLRRKLRRKVLQCSWSRYMLRILFISISTMTACWVK